MNLDYFVDHDIHAGLSGIDVDFKQLDLGNGLLLRQTYAHLMAPFVMAFGRPELGKPHPAPWKAALGGLGLDITAELVIPRGVDTGSAHRVDVVRMINALIRMWVMPTVVVPVLSNISFSDAAKAPDNTTHFFPFEVQPRFFPIDLRARTVTQLTQFEWVRNNWRSAIELASANNELRIAVAALDALQFIPDSGLGLISLWGALEALFSPAKTELRFRVSALIASYLEPFGPARAALQKKTARLYDARSAVAHGAGNRDLQLVLDTYDVLRRVVFKIFTDQHVPSKLELEANLFGSAETIEGDS
jgi:hypothetical protein